MKIREYITKALEIMAIAYEVSGQNVVSGTRMDDCRRLRKLCERA